MNLIRCGFWVMIWHCWEADWFSEGKFVKLVVISVQVNARITAKWDKKVVFFVLVFFKRNIWTFLTSFLLTSFFMCGLWLALFWVNDSPKNVFFFCLLQQAINFVEVYQGILTLCVGFALKTSCVSSADLGKLLPSSSVPPPPLDNLEHTWACGPLVHSHWPI